MRLSMSYTPYATFSKGKTGNIITFTHFEEGDLSSKTRNLLSETCDNTEGDEKSDDDPTMPPLINE